MPTEPCWQLKGVWLLQDHGFHFTYIRKEHVALANYPNPVRYFHNLQDIKTFLNL